MANDRNTETQLQDMHFERSPIKCGRCGRLFEHFMFEEIEDLVQLRCGDVIIPHTKMICLHCGWSFYWDVNDKMLQKMSVAYAELTILIKRYTPE